jgi:hypothetical protein
VVLRDGGVLRADGVALLILGALLIRRALLNTWCFSASVLATEAAICAADHRGGIFYNKGALQ